MQTNAAGNHLYSKRFGGPESDWARAVDFDNENHPLVAGHFRASMPVGASVLTSAGGDDIFVFQLDAEGNPVWAQRYGGPGEDRAHGLATRADGSFVMSGYFQGSVSLGGPPLMAAAGARGMFVAAYSTNGAHLWSKTIGSAGTVNFDFPAIGVDKQGNVLLTGACSGPLDFGAGPVACPGSDALFLAKLGPAGQPIWHKVVSGNNKYGYGITADAKGNVIVAGHFLGVADLGLGPLTSSGSYDVFVAKYAP